jgi:hypothetical protein
MERYTFGQSLDFYNLKEKKKERKKERKKVTLTFTMGKE